MCKSEQQAGSLGMLPFKSKFGRCIECMVQIERSSTKQANKNNTNFTTIFLVCLMHILFFAFCLCLSGVEIVDSRTARTSFDNSVHKNIFQTQFTFENSNPGCAHVRKYIYENVSLTK